MLAGRGSASLGAGWSTSEPSGVRTLGCPGAPGRVGSGPVQEANVGGGETTVRGPGRPLLGP